MDIEAFLLPSVSTMTVGQFLIGSLLGVGVGITLSRNGIMVSNPQTRWLFITILFAVSGLYGLLCGLLNS